MLRCNFNHRCKPKCPERLVELLAKGLDLVFDHGCKIWFMFAFEISKEDERRYAVARFPSGEFSLNEQRNAQNFFQVCKTKFIGGACHFVNE
jgi:hypothetical protein